MDGILSWLIQFVSDANHPAGLAALAGSAALEYVFPPFPGDTITLFGAVLITAYQWSFAPVFGAVMLGSCAGAMLDYYVGHRLRLRRQRRRPQEEQENRAVIDRLVAKFERHGAAYLVINRFLPGIRALFFVAAGLAGMRPLPVLLYSALSAALWNLGVIALGSLLGANFERMLELSRQYALVMWVIIGAVVLLVVVRALLRRRRRAAR